MLGGDDVVGAGVEGDFHERILGGLVLGDEELAEVMEFVEHGARAGQVAAKAGEDAAHLGGGAVLVVRGHLHDQGDAARRVAFVGHLIVDHAGQLARALLDGAVDVVGGHVGLARLHEDGAQARVHAGIATAGLGGDGDLAREAAENLAPARIGDGLGAFDFGPFAMTRHGEK